MATLNITVPTPAVPRIRAAVAKAMGVPAPATNEQISDHVRKHLRALCVQEEQRQRREAAETDAAAAIESEFPDG